MGMNHPGNNIKSYMKNRKLGVREVARMTGYSPAAVSDIMHCRRNITPRFSIMFSMALQLGLPRFFYDLQCTYNFNNAIDKAFEDGQNK